MLNNTQIREIGKFAENLGFVNNGRSAERGFFEAKQRDFNVCVEYDYNIVNKSYDVMISNSSMNTKDTMVVRLFSDYMQKAIILSNKIWTENCKMVD